MNIYANSPPSASPPPVPPRTNSPLTASTRTRANTYCHRPLPPLPAQARVRRGPRPPLPAQPQGRSLKRNHTFHTLRTAPKPHLSHFPTPPPLLHPSEQVDALSLEDQTFIFILGNVDSYPIDLLALLPSHLRRKLLSSLPPLRLYQLEQTPLARGINTDQIWERMSTLQDYTWGGYLKGENLNQDSSERPEGSSGGDNKSESARTRFINYLSHLLFNEMNRDYACKRMTCLLHATHVDMLAPHVANTLMCGHVGKLFMFQPPAFLIPFRCPNLTERELYCTLCSNKMLPTSLEFYTYNVDFSPLWNQDVHVSQEMKRRLLSQLQLLRVYNHSNRTEQLDEIMSAATHSSKYKNPPSLRGNLQTLEIIRADDDHLATILPHFSAPTGYSHLTTLKVSMRPAKGLKGSTTRHLAPIIKHQLGSLQHLELRLYNCNITRNGVETSDFMLFSYLSNFILSPKFRSLSFKKCKQLPWYLVQTLLEANLRTVPSQNQTILFDEVNITTRGRPRFTLDDNDQDNTNTPFYPARDQKCVEHKRIHFRDSHLPEDALRWFETTEWVYVHTLEFNKVEVDVSDSDVYCETDYAEFLSGSRRGGYGYNMKRRLSVKESERRLKEIFVGHEDFQCRMFVWEKVTTDTVVLLAQ